MICSDEPTQDISSSLYRAFADGYDFLLLLNTVVLIVLPAGDIGGLNIKVFLFFLVLGPAVLRFFEQQPKQVYTVTLLLAVPCILLAWAMLGFWNGAEESLPFQQYKDIMVTIAGAWFIKVYCLESPAHLRKLLRTVIYTAAGTSLFKVGLTLYAMVHGNTVTRYVEAISNFFNVKLMTVEVGDALFGRFELISDSVIPLCMFAIFAKHKQLGIGSFKALIIAVLMALSLIMGFSRYLWAFGAVAIIMGLLVAKKGKLHAWFIAIFSIGMFAALPSLIQLFTLRFSSGLAEDSDQARHAQNIALSDFFNVSPLFGHGLGTYTTAVIRSEKAPYSYEDQVFALLAQMGIVGTALLGLLVLYYFRDIVLDKQERPLYKFVLVAMLGMWIAGGFLNPQLMSSSASVFFGFLFALSIF